MKLFEEECHWENKPQMQGSQAGEWGVSAIFCIFTLVVEGKTYFCKNMLLKGI